jgi:hypothetical protein
MIFGSLYTVCGEPDKGWNATIVASDVDCAACLSEEIEYVANDEIDIQEENRILIGAGIACLIGVIIVLICWWVLLGELA